MGKLPGTNSPSTEAYAFSRDVSETHPFETPELVREGVLTFGKAWSTRGCQLKPQSG